MTGERLAGATPALVMLAALVALTVLVAAESRRTARSAAGGHRTAVRPHSARTGTATGDHKAITEHDLEQQMTDETDETCDCGGCDDGPDYGRIDETTTPTGDPR